MPGRMSKFEQYQEQRRAELNETIDGWDDLIKIMLDSQKRPKHLRVINPSQKRFIQDPAPVKLFMGPGGSGKTIIGVTDIILKALVVPGSKWFIARRDYNDLLKTTARTAEGIMQRLPNGTLLDKQKTPPMEWHIKPIATPENPMPESSSITWIGLNDWMGSFEYCGGFIDELDEIDEDFFWQMKSRIRYIPSGYPAMEVYPITGSFNPPPKTHWLYKNCTGMEMDGTPYKDGKPTVSLHTPDDPQENKLNLRKGYYEEMDVMPDDLQQRYLKNEWVDVFPGAPVYGQFNEKLHVNPNIRFHNNTLYRFWDFGYNRPSCHFAQVNTNGWLQVMREFMGKQIEGGQFINTINMQTSVHYPEALAIVDVGDIAVKQQKDTGSMLRLLTEAGINMTYKTVPLDVSHALMRKQLSTLIAGVPALQLHPDCKVTIAGFKGGYRLKDDGVTPFKDGYYDHLMDDLRYGVFSLYGNGLVRVATPSEAAKYSNSRAVWNTIKH